MKTTYLSTPPLPRIVPDGVFTSFGWCASGTLEWRTPIPFQDSTPLHPDNPERLVFVMRREETRFPREYARLHATGLGLTDEWALAPYGIDDATDGLFEHRIPPTDLFWLAADNLNALVWGLHDWCHFHNHGPFEERAWTELQCDFSALVWLRLNREAIGLSDVACARVHRELRLVSEHRFRSEEKPFPAELLSEGAVAAHVREVSPASKL